MDRSYHVEAPFEFNLIKHHLQFIRNELKYAETPALPDLLNRIGNSQFDLYTGVLYPPEIIRDLRMYLEREAVFGRIPFIKWLGSRRGFRTVTIRDGSVWVLRCVPEADRFLHIHPARYSPNSIRVRSVSLKSAFLALTEIRKAPEEALDVVNRVRQMYLELPPLKNIDPRQGTGKIMELLSGV